MKSIQVDELLRFAQAALEAAGVGAEDARTIANTLVTTDTFGVFSHGTNNLYNYIRKIQAGGLDAKAVPTVEKEGPSWAIVNGNAAMGMVSSCRAMGLATEKAKKTGIAYVGVHNSCHFGAAGYYANLAAQQGLLGIAMSNTDPNMAIPGSRDVAIGYGFAIMVEILASVLTGAGLLSQVVSWNLDLEAKNNVGHAFIAVDLAQMLPMDEFEARMEQMVQELESAPLAKNAQKIFVPGEMEWAKREKALAENRLELADNMAENLEKAAALTKTSLHWLAD